MSRSSVNWPWKVVLTTPGYLLTLCPAVGVDYLDKDMDQYLLNSSRCVYDNEHASAITQVFEQFKHTGTDLWHQKSVEWLLIYILTEIGATPHNRRKGYNCPTVMDAYETVIHDLVCGIAFHNRKGSY